MEHEILPDTYDTHGNSYQDGYEAGYESAEDRYMAVINGLREEIDALRTLIRSLVTGRS